MLYQRNLCFLVQRRFPREIIAVLLCTQQGKTSFIKIHKKGMCGIRVFLTLFRRGSLLKDKGLCDMIGKE